MFMWHKLEGGKAGHTLPFLYVADPTCDPITLTISSLTTKSHPSPSTPTYTTIPHNHKDPTNIPMMFKKLFIYTNLFYLSFSNNFIINNI